MHENANTISAYEDSNFRMGFKRFSKIPIGRISYRPQKNKYSLKNDSLEALVHLSKEKKNYKLKIKSLDKYSEKNDEKMKDSINEINSNNTNKNNINDKNTNDKSINDNISSIGNIIYSKRCILARKKIQFSSPIPNGNSFQNNEKNQFNGIKRIIPRKNDSGCVIERMGSQIDFFPKNNNKKISNKIIIHKKNDEILLSEKEERKNINNNKDSSLIRRSMHKIIPSGITKKIKVNKIVNLNG